MGLTKEFAYAVRPGVYEHFKGNRYLVLGMARHSETLEEMVIYQALYGERGVWVRPAAMWAQEAEQEGRRITRFTFVAEAGDAQL